MGIRGTAVLVEISANDGQTKFSVMVEPNGETGSFNLYNKTTGALIGTVNNSTVGWVVTPAGPLQVVAQQVNKSPAELQQELNIVQQLFTIFNNYQQNPIDPDRRGDNQQGPQNSGPGGSGAPLNDGNQNGQQTNITVTITQIDNAGLPGSNTQNGGTGTGTGTGTFTDGPSGDDPLPLPLGTFTLINGSGVIVGTPGQDHIFGSDGIDTITALGSDDQVFAGAGDDIIVAGEGGGDDFYDGGDHEHGDTIKYQSANGVTFDLNVGSYTLPGGTIVSLSTADGTDIGHDQFVRVEKIVGSSGDDVFIVHQWVDWEIDAGEGIDIVRFADGLDVQNVEGGQEISHFEIVDLATDTTENIVYFDLSDFDSIGNSVPLRILGGANDIIHLTTDFDVDAQWTPHGTFTDAAGTGESDPFSDSYSNGITFDVYEVTIGEGSYLVYVQQGVQIDLDNANPTAGNVTILANALGNGGFDAGFDGWTINLQTSGTSSTVFSSATIDRTGTPIEGDDAVAVLTFAAWVPDPYDTGYGPSITSEIFEGNAGDVFSFIYQLNSGGDQAIGSAYLRDEYGNIVETIFNYQTPFSGSTGVQTYTLTLEQSGSFMLDFRVGSYDWTGGRYIGATLDIGFAGIIQNGVSEDAIYTIAAGELLANATDSDDDTLTLASVGTSGFSANGALVFINRDGSVTYDPTTAAAIQALAAGETLNDTFTFTVQDEHGAVSNTATATITVVGANEAPTTDDLDVALPSGAEYIAITLTGEDSDGTVAGFQLTSLSLEGDLSRSSDFSTLLDDDDLNETLYSSTIYFRPNQNFSGNATFQYAAVDDDGTKDITPATATITVLPLVDASPPEVNLHLAPLAATDEFAISDTTKDHHNVPAIAPLADGKFVAVYMSSPADGGFDIYGRVFNSDGSPVATATLLNGSQNANWEGYPDVVGLSDGGYVVVFADTNTNTIYGTRVSVDGEQTPFFIDSDNAPGFPKVAALPDGGFVVTWFGKVGSSDSIYLRVFDQTGPSTSVISVETPTGYDAFLPDVTRLDNGDLLICWGINGLPQYTGVSSGNAIRATIIDAETGIAGATFQVNTSAMDFYPSEANYGGREFDQFFASSTCAINDGFVVTWTSEQDGDFDIFGQVFNLEGEKIGVEFKASSDLSDEGLADLRPAITALSDGGFVVAWHRGPLVRPENEEAVTPSDEIVIQRFDAQGEKLGGELIANLTNPGRQYYPAIAETSDGKLAVVWHSSQNGEGGSDAGIYGRIFDLPGLGAEDGTILLPLQITIPEAENPLTLDRIVITGLPEDATLNIGERVDTDWVIDRLQDDPFAADFLNALANGDTPNPLLTLTPPQDFNGDLAISFVATLRDTVTDEETSNEPAALSVHVIAVNDAPEIHVESASTTEEDADTTLAGLSVTDPDSGPEEHFTATVTALHGSLQLATPGFNQFDEDESSGVIRVSDKPLGLINQALDDGIVYTAPSYSEGLFGLTDTVTLTVTDAQGASDVTNFIFSVFGDTGVDLTGTEQKDVLFSTGHNDTFTGNGGSDTFAFGNEGSNGSGQDTILDFAQGQDKIALYGIFDDFQAMQVAGAFDTVNNRIDIGGDNWIALGAVRVDSLSANDFIFHQNNNMFG
jgi:VCBS repeat-containing protein